MVISTKQKIYAGVGLAALTAGFIIYKKNADKIKLVKDVKAFKGKTVGGINSVETARQLGQDLGTIYGWADPRHWTENDDAATATMMSLPVAMVPAVSLEYAKLTKSDLQADCQRLLSAKDYAKIRNKFI